ncbi:hypothetical protein Fcan01_27277 [Folsomia candida]|uniref:Uncharacterized protein n=1 Tax=Folsomia candida TaxID=158441 RepID=A0A226CY63_FOLCA|nr:hypothetical protein Fcan01_27277 [Folsomia candida]
MPPKKPPIHQYAWHRIPQYERERSQSIDASAVPDPDKTTSLRTTRSRHSFSTQHRLIDSDADAPTDAAADNDDDDVSNNSMLDFAFSSSSTSQHKIDPGVSKARIKNKVAYLFTFIHVWSFGVAERVEEKVHDVAQRRRSSWILVDDMDTTTDDEGDGDDPDVPKSLHGEIVIEDVILPKDRSRLNFNLFWKDEAKFLQEVEIFLDIHVRNWYAIHGDGCRRWKLPTSVHTWFGEWGTFLSYFHDPLYWIGRYPSHLPTRYTWDTAIASHSALETYFELRRKCKAPTFWSWACQGMERLEERRNADWSYCGYDNTPNKFDFNVKVQVLPGEEKLTQKSILSYIWGQESWSERWKAVTFFALWGSKGRVEIYHYRDAPSLGGAYTDLIELPFVTLHQKFPQLKDVLYDNVAPMEWQVYRRCIESAPDIDPDLDIVHAYTNYDVHGGKHAAKYYEGQQYIICDRFQEDYDEPSGDWWYFPRNYRYEMQRGLGHVTDTWTRTRAPLYERMIELSSVGEASDPKPPWRKGAFQNLGWFLDQFLFHFLPFVRRTRVALDLVTRPFSYRETSLSRLDGTLFLISRTCRILSKNPNDSKAWLDLKRIIDTAGAEVETGMQKLLDSLEPILTIFRSVHYRLAWASMKLEASQSHWRILVGRSYYLMGLFRFDVLHGFFYNRHFKDRYYGVPGLYSSSRHIRQLDPYNEYNLEQFPLKGKTDPEKRPRHHIPGSETPPKPSFVPWDKAESVERIPLGDDKKVHVHLPLEERCVPLGAFGAGEKTEIFASLFQNVVDMVTLARGELDDAIGAIYKYKDEGDLVFRTPTGPVGPKDPGYHDLLHLLHNPRRINPLDTTPLAPFDALLAQWDSIVEAASSRKFRHMLGPGAYRLSQSLEQIFDLYQEVHLLIPHVERMKTFLKTNLRLVRGLSMCQNRGQVASFVLKKDPFAPFKSSLLRMWGSQAFYVVRFSVTREQNARLARAIPPQVKDTLSTVEDKLEEYYYLKNRHYEGYVNAARERGRLSRVKRRLRVDRHRARMHSISLNEEDSNWRGDETGFGAGGAARRLSSADLFYLQDDRPQHVGGKVFIFEEKDGDETSCGGAGGAARRFSSADIFYLEDDRPQRVGGYEIGRTCRTRPTDKKKKKISTGGEKSLEDPRRSELLFDGALPLRRPPRIFLHFKDRYYRVPGLYSSSRHIRQLDPYNLKQIPLKKKTDAEKRPRHLISGSETLRNRTSFRGMPSELGIRRRFSTVSKRDGHHDLGARRV